MSTIGKSKETLITDGQGLGLPKGKTDVTANGYRGILLGMMKIFWNQMSVMAPQLCEYTKNQ